MISPLDMANLMLLIVGLVELFWIWMLIDCATTKSLGIYEKMIWVAILIVTQGIGAIAYAFLISSYGAQTFHRREANLCVRKTRNKR
jgi:hypothetical protein